MKNHLIDVTIAPESITGIAAGITSIKAEVSTFSLKMDDAQRKHSQKIGTRNETFAREMLEFARQRPDLRPGGIDFAAIERDLTARDQVTPMLLELKALVRCLEDTHTALGVDLFNGTRGMYMAMKPIAEINGVQDVIDRIGQRFVGQGRRKKAPDTISLESSGL